MRGDRIEAKLRAKKGIKGNWIALFFTGVLIGLPESVIGAISSALKENLSDVGVVAAVTTILSLLSVAVGILLLPADAALEKKYLAVARGQDRQSVSVLCYYRERDWQEKIKAYFLAGLYTVLGLILCVIPGIFIAVRYSMLGYVFADNPNIGYRDAMDKCKELTAGRTWEIIVFHLSFIGWHLLAVLTLGILELWVVPYECTAFAAYYDIIRPVEEIKEEPDDIFSEYGKNTDGIVF